MNITLQDLQNQIHAIGGRLKALERVQVPANPPPPMTTSAAQDASIAAADEETKSQLVRNLETERDALLKLVSDLSISNGQLNSNISDMLMINNAVAATLRMPAELNGKDMTAKDLPTWATHIMEGR